MGIASDNIMGQSVLVYSEIEYGKMVTKTSISTDAI